MGLILDRTVRRVAEDGATGPPEPLAEYRETPAWVLLGDPGAGKTTAFEEEARRDRDGTHFVLARDFRTFEPSNRPEWRGRTLLIDGLDEVRAGKVDARTPFDEIRGRLDQLGRPRFRLSSREADWLGKNDRERLKEVSPNGEVVVLRLEPFEDDQIRRLVSELLAASAPEAFFERVSDRGLEGLLGNPQNLELLAKVFRKLGDLPPSRLETFEQASILLAREQNEKHEVAGREATVEAVLPAAGRLCAVQLLSGSAGHRLSENDTTAESIPISVYGSGRRDDLLAALRTRLFVADGERRFRPAHAHLAAFLAACHLATLVADLPCRRILSLLVGPDGAPPTPLRGLVAWLAAVSPELRKPLIERDPAAVLMYGDVRGFAPEEKEDLLIAIGGDPFRLYGSSWLASAVEGLVSSDMEALLLKRLRDPDRRGASRKVVEVVVHALRHAPPTPHLTDELPAISLDATRSSEARCVAMRAWIRHLDDAPDRVPRLLECLVEVHKRPTEPVECELLALLLEPLYPGVLSASEMWDYFPPNPGRTYRDQRGDYWRRRSGEWPDEDLPEHLDKLVGLWESLRSALDCSRLLEVPVRLLARGLHIHGDTVERSRLLGWFRLLISAHDAYGVEESIERIRQWMEGRPHIHKMLMEHALRSDSVELTHFLLEATPPSDIADWNLERAVSAHATEPEIAEAHLREFTEALRDRPTDVDRLLVEARRRLASWPAGIAHLDRNLKSELSENYFEHRIFWWHLLSEKKAAKTQLVETVRRHAESLRENRAHPGLLDYLSTILRDPVDWTKSDTVDRSKLMAALGGDRKLVEAAVAGITGAPEREDLPTVDQILDLRRRDRMSLLEMPVLLGLSMRPAGEILRLDECRIRAALAFRLNRLSSAEDTDWYRICLREHPELVAEVLMIVGRQALSDCGHHSLRDLYYFSRKEIYAPVAKRATLPLLRSFPLRATASQLDSLTALLQSALVHCEDSEFRTLIDERTALSSMTRRQRATWFAAGIVLDPDEYGAKLMEVADSKTRVAALEAFHEAVTAHRIPRLEERLTPAVREILIREIGASTAPLPPGTLSWGVGPSLSVGHFIQELSRNSEPAATEALGRLAADARLAPWRSELEGALGTQRVVRRDASYEAPTVRTVIEVLDDGPPADAEDLRELVVDRLERIAGEIRTTNANLWRQFWNEDAGGSDKSKHENACRDALLARLRDRLPVGCDAQPEGQYAGNTRADLRVTYGEWNVPVEIKKNRHSDLWRAVRNQLLPRYANDPATEGLGIYLVLWFGARVTTVAENDRPASPDALREHLLAELTPAERRRAAVIVMDVTPPHGAAAAAADRRGASPGSPSSERGGPGSDLSTRRRPPGLPNEPAAERRRVG